MIFSGSMEFEKRYNQEVQERPSDNIELPKVNTQFFYSTSLSVPSVLREISLLESYLYWRGVCIREMSVFKRCLY